MMAPGVGALGSILPGLEEAVLHRPEPVRHAAGADRRLVGHPRVEVGRHGQADEHPLHLRSGRTRCRSAETLQRELPAVRALEIGDLEDQHGRVLPQPFVRLSAACSRSRACAAAAAAVPRRRAMKPSCQQRHEACRKYRLPSLHSLVKVTCHGRTQRYTARCAGCHSTACTAALARSSGPLPDNGRRPGPAAAGPAGAPPRAGRAAAPAPRRSSPGQRPVQLVLVQQSGAAGRSCRTSRQRSVVAHSSGDAEARTGVEDVGVAPGEPVPSAVEAADVVPRAVEGEPDDGCTGLQDGRVAGEDGRRQGRPLHERDGAVAS
jgi:hypothetical protein